ncbi:hypothetical protein PIB30_095239 [Stylosanthes scabra]|uniref:Transposase MuDR plant domain-containing protein n=1 Tax=Stylosanthes scabra TaxID=79078 RepID=A0ABU6RWI6_9FABA|nr:hypothetical protein [Stylosanthes scabra]
MDDGILIAIHYAGQIRKDQNGNDVFSCSQPAFVRWPNEEIGLKQLKAFILRSIGQGDTKRVQKVYYRYPHEVDGTFCFKRFHLRDDADVALIREWHLHLAVMPLFELYALLIDEGNNSEANSQSGGGQKETSGSPREVARVPSHFQINQCSDVVDSHDESVEEEDDEEEEEGVQGVNYFGQTQPAYAQPAISRPYDHPGHFKMLNLGAMDPGSHGFQGGPNDDPVDEFEVGQEFADKEAAVMAVKTYCIRRAVEYKILESDRLKYTVQCAQFGMVCRWSICISYHRKQEKWEVRRYNGPHGCVQTPARQDHRRLD